MGVDPIIINQISALGGETTCELTFSAGPMGKAGLERAKQMGKILVVENERRLCSAIVAHLKSKGAHPIAATTAQEAVNTLDKGEIDLVVLDLKLGNGDGMDVLRHIRRSPDLAALPVLVVSAWEMEPASYDYLEPGDYLTKPFDMRMLDLVVRQLLEGPQNQHPTTSATVLSLKPMDHEISSQTCHRAESPHLGSRQEPSTQAQAEGLRAELRPRAEPNG